jgi:hypothetical protein
MPRSVSVHARLHTFIGSLPRQRDTYSANLLLSSLGTWLRYYGFLEVVRSRYGETSIRSTEAIRIQQENIRRETQTNQPSSCPYTQEEWLELQNLLETSKMLHLDIESFYMFADILLDRMASTFSYYFWRNPKWNHRKLVDHIEKICEGKRLTITNGEILTIPYNLLQIVVEYRNKHIQHAQEPRLIFTTSWDSDLKAKIRPMLSHSQEGEVESFQKSTHDLNDILDLIGRYIIAMLDVFEANADKSVFPHKQADGE